MSLWRKLENKCDDASCSGLIYFLEKYLKARSGPGTAELTFFSSFQCLQDLIGPQSPSAASVDCSLLKRFSHGSARSAVSPRRLTRRRAQGTRLLPKVRTK